MTPFVVGYVSITEKEISLFKRVCYLVKRIPDMEICSPGLWGDSWREGSITCHVMTRVVAHFFPELEVEDGDLFDFWDHSWLVFRDIPKRLGVEHPGKVIIDPYPRAAASGPLLLLSQESTPWSRMYENAGCYPHMVLREERFLREVARVIRATEEYLEPDWLKKEALIA